MTITVIDGDADALPAWLLVARTEDATVSVVNGVVTWQAGTWKDGIWDGGTWENGIWENGIWEGGTWRGGSWLGGTWENGIWEGGTWRGGSWLGGTWEDGTWEGGIWEGGFWQGGTWRGGDWRGGKTVPRCRWACACDPIAGTVSLGCNTRTIAAWDAFFAGDGEIVTPRGTEQFRLLRATYEALRAFVVSTTAVKERAPSIAGSEELSWFATETRGAPAPKCIPSFLFPVILSAAEETLEITYLRLDDIGAVFTEDNKTVIQARGRKDHYATTREPIDELLVRMSYGYNRCETSMDGGER